MEKQQGGSPTWQQSGGQKIDLNTATKDQLMSLMGVSDKRADQIISYRSEHGGFSNVEQLKDVEGFSDVLTDDFRAALTIGSPSGKSEEKGGGKR